MLSREEMSDISSAVRGNEGGVRKHGENGERDNFVKSTMAYGWMMKKWRNGGREGGGGKGVITAVDGTTAGKKCNFGCVGRWELCSCLSPAVFDRYFPPLLVMLYIHACLCAN